MTKCPDCGGSHVRCLTCGTVFDVAEGAQLVLDILSRAEAPIYGTTLAGLSGYSVPGMYNVLDRLIAQGRVEKIGGRGRRRGYQLVRIIPFPQVRERAELAA